MASVIIVLIVVTITIVAVPLMIVFSGYDRIMALDARCDTALADIDV